MELTRLDLIPPNWNKTLKCIKENLALFALLQLLKVQMIVVFELS